MWYRVFAASEAEPNPAHLVAFLRQTEASLEGHFRGDDQGWFAGTLQYDFEAAPLELQRYLATEEGLRAELNSWAAWLETAEHSPHHLDVMRHVATARQLVTLRLPRPCRDATRAERLALATCCWLALHGNGVYQVDGCGFFTADSALLVAEW